MLVFGIYYPKIYNHKNHVLLKAESAMRGSLAVACLCLVLVTVPAYSQTSNASLGGTVTDASGAYIPGVTITATNTGTNIVNTTITNEAGAYNFPSLQDRKSVV